MDLLAVLRDNREYSDGNELYKHAKNLSKCARNIHILTSTMVDALTIYDCLSVPNYFSLKSDKAPHLSVGSFGASVFPSHRIQPLHHPNHLSTRPNQPIKRF